MIVIFGVFVLGSCLGYMVISYYKKIWDINILIERGFDLFKCVILKVLNLDKVVGWY